MAYSKDYREAAIAYKAIVHTFKEIKAVFKIKAGDDTPLWFWNGDYNVGVNDLVYREFYVRWLQYGAFLPMFCAHGTDTSREPWNFGKPGETFYDAILKFINLRYRLLPYIYSIAAAVSQSHDTMLRSLMFDFAHDKNVWDICDSYMFGKSLVVCPVTEAMYYEPNSVSLENTDKTRTVYLPKTSGWYDFWTNERYSGGQTLSCKATLDTLPLFVTADSISPLSGPLAYADEKKRRDIGNTSLRRCGWGVYAVQRRWRQLFI